MKIKILAITAIIEIITLHAWFICQSFTDMFHYSSINVVLQLSTYINAFKGYPFWLIRLFHNKLVQIPINFFRLYLKFWDIRFGINWFSLIGYFGIFAGFYYLFLLSKKQYYHWLTLGILGIIPCFEILDEPHMSVAIKSIYLWLPYTIFSLYGIYQFLNHGNTKKRLLFILILLVLSLFWIAFLPYDMPQYCIRYAMHIKHLVK